MNWLSAATVLSAVLSNVDTSQAQALTGAADTMAESGASLDRLRSAAYSAFTRQEYALQPDGNLRGKVQAVDTAGSLTPARVKLFFVRHGEIISQASPDTQGVFQVGGLAPGYYSVISQGDSGFSSVGVKVVAPPEKSEAPKANTIGRTREVSLAKVEGPGADSLNIVVVKAGDVSAAWGVARMMNGMPGSPMASVATTGTNRLVSANEKANEAVEAVQYDDELLIAAYERGTFTLRPDGKISGKLMMFDNSGNYVVAPNMPAFFLRDGRVVAQTRSDASGNYEVSLSPGYYSFVTAGFDRFGAAGITVTAPPAGEQVPTSPVKSISFNAATRQPGQQPGPGGGGGGQGDANAAGGGGAGGGGFAGGGSWRWCRGRRRWWCRRRPWRLRCGRSNGRRRRSGRSQQQ
ncbi:MAG: hypothetical protein QM775_12930 [Pirellulales bacterium]